MSSTAPPASSAAPSQTAPSAQASRAGASGGRHATEPGADNSLFANLLSLLGDTHDQPLPTLIGESGAGAGEVDAPLADGDAPDDNPLAALAGWPGSPVPADTTGGQDAPATERVEGRNAGQLQRAGADQAVAEDTATGRSADPDAATDRAAHESPLTPPATAQRGPAVPKGLSATAQAQVQAALKGSSGASAAAATSAQAWAAQGDGGMVWRRAGGGASTEGLQQAGAAHLAGVRSTVTLNERFGNLGGGDIGTMALREAGAAAPAGSPVGAAAAASAPGTGSGIGSGDAGGADHAGGDHADDNTAAEQDGQGGDARAAQAEEEPQISHWGTQNLRHASLRVGQAGEDAIDIQLSVKGQEAQIEFRTDNAEARASLEDSADESLSEMLQRSGIQLASLSVGSQGQPSGRDASAGGPGAPRAARSPASASDAAELPAARPLPPRADGSRPLDLFV